MTVVELRVERTKATILARWRREFAMAGMTAPEAQMQQALDVLVPGICEYLAADAALKRSQKPPTTCKQRLEVLEQATSKPGNFRHSALKRLGKASFALFIAADFKFLTLIQSDDRPAR